MKVTQIVTDDTLRELREHGNADFPFQYYYDNIKLFDKEYIEWHWHNEFEFLTVEFGPVDCLIGTQRIRLQAGDAMFINSGVIHRYESPVRGTMPNILFSPDFLAQPGSAVHKKYIAPLMASSCRYLIFPKNAVQNHAFLHQLGELYSLAVSNASMKELRLKAQAYDLWILLLEHARCLPADEKGGRDMLLQARLQHMLQFICERYGEKISLQDIAGAANISKSEALRCFRAGMDTTPVGYLTQYRLNRAKELLLGTDGTISSIALETGFESGGYFTRIFTKAFGMAPKAFRERHRT